MLSTPCSSWTSKKVPSRPPSALCHLHFVPEFNDAKGWVESSLNFDVNKDVNLFECTIRILGGLLSAYHLSKEPVFLEKAVSFSLDEPPLFLTFALCRRTWPIA